jgi:N-terminal half of MaoC dehydratase
MTERKTVEQLYSGTHDLTSARIGDQLGSMSFTISEDQVERNAWANDDYNPWYMDDSPFGGRIISPVYPASFDAKLFYGYYSYPPGGSLFAKQEFEYLIPLRIGVEYTMTGTLSDIYQRKGRTFYVASMSVIDPGGAEVMRMRKTIAWPVKPTVAGREER